MLNTVSNMISLVAGWPCKHSSTLQAFSGHCQQVPLFRPEHKLTAMTCATKMHTSWKNTDRPSSLCPGPTFVLAARHCLSCNPHLLLVSAFLIKRTLLQYPERHLRSSSCLYLLGMMLSIAFDPPSFFQMNFYHGMTLAKCNLRGTRQASLNPYRTYRYCM